MRLLKFLVFSTVFALVGCVSSPLPHSSQNDGAEMVTHAGSALGTKWGEQTASSVTKVNLSRTTSDPIDDFILIYVSKLNNEAKNLKKLNQFSLAHGQIDFTLQATSPIKLFYDQASAQKRLIPYIALAKAGENYALVYHNRSNRTFEIIASVDGANVISGSDIAKGYVLRPHSTLTIEGFRTSDNTVARFVFSHPSESYALHSGLDRMYVSPGDISTTVFELATPNAQEQNEGYAQPPRN